MKLLVFILLLLHVNSFLFISQADEQDVCEARGQQVHDIDSLTDWLQQALAKEKKKGSHNEKKDDRDARFFHLLKPHHFFSPQFVLIKKTGVSANRHYAPVVNDSNILAGFSSIQSPPPKA